MLRSLGAATSLSGSARCYHNITSAMKALFVGDYQFKYAATVAAELESASNLWVTSIYPEDVLRRRFPESAAHIDELRSRGAHLIFEFNSELLNMDTRIASQKFDRILVSQMHDTQEAPVKNAKYPTCLWDQEMMDAIIRAGADALTPDGQLFLTCRTKGSKSLKELKEVASLAKMRIIGTVDFPEKSYPFYPGVKKPPNNKHSIIETLVFGKT